MKRGRGKGTSLNSTCLTPKLLAPSVYVHVPEAPSPHERSISVMSLRQVSFGKEEETRRVEKGTQLESITICVPVSSPRGPGVGLTV